MRRTILTPPSHMRLHHIATIQKRHLAIRLHPHLVSRMRCNHIQRRDMYSEFSRLGELADAGAEREEVGTGDTGGEVGE